MLRVENVHAYYGLSHILFGVSLTEEQGEIVCRLGDVTEFLDGVVLELDQSLVFAEKEDAFHPVADTEQETEHDACQGSEQGCDVEFQGDGIRIDVETAEARGCDLLVRRVAGAVEGPSSHSSNALEAAIELGQMSTLKSVRYSG